MYKKLIDYIKGYLLIELTGFKPERFFNICRHRRIALWKICCINGTYLFFVYANKYKGLKEISRKSGVRIKIKKKYGLPFSVYRNKHRKGYALGIIAALILLYTLSLFIWNIEITGNKEYSEDTIKTKLASIDICCGIRKNVISCENIEEFIRSEFDEVSWVSAQIFGTKLKISIKEAITTVKPQEENKLYNIVAAKEGIVTDIIVRSGTATVRRYDKVSPGDVLIDGHMVIYDDNEEISQEYDVSADGEITGIGNYTIIKSYPYIHKVMAYTGNRRNGMYITMLGKNILLMLPDNAKNHFIYKSDTYQLRLIDNFYIPVYITYISGKEYTDYDESYSKRQMNFLGKQINNVYYEKLLKKGVQIIENNVKIQCNEHSWNVICSFTVKEELGKREETKTVDERN